MKKVLTRAVVLIVASAATLPTMAAPRNGGNAYVATKHKTTRVSAQADCTRQANDMMYGSYIIQRKNFLRDCMMERGFR